MPQEAMALCCINVEEASESCHLRKMLPNALLTSGHASKSSRYTKDPTNNRDLFEHDSMDQL